MDALRTKDAETQVLLLKILRNLSELRDKSTAPFTEADAVRTLVEVLGTLSSKSSILQQHLIFNVLLPLLLVPASPCRRSTTCARSM